MTTDSGRRIGDPCEAIIASFIFGPVVCGLPSVTTATDLEWGTTHVVCASHTTRHTTPADTAGGEER